MAPYPYKQLYKPNHPNSTGRGYITEHRYVMSEHLGRPLKPGEHVHHKDENPKNNSIDNLELITHADHAKHHLLENQDKMNELANSTEAKAKKRQTFQEIRHQQGTKNSQYGTMWITNGSDTKKISKTDKIPEGYRRGRK